MKDNITTAVNLDITNEIHILVIMEFGSYPDFTINFKFPKNNFGMNVLKTEVFKKTGVAAQTKSQMRKAYSKYSKKERYESWADGSDVYPGDSSDDTEYAHPSEKEYGVSDNSDTQTFYNFYPEQKVLLLDYHTANKRGCDPMLYYYRDSDMKFVEQVHNIIDEFGYKAADESSVKQQIYMLVQKGNRISLEEFDINNLKVPDKPLTHYNDSFEDFSAHLESQLKRKDRSGLAILHGCPGSGKTTYIRYLLGVIKNKKMIYIPPSMASSIANPDMLSIFLDYKDSVLVIEDAEEVLRHRDADNQRSQQAVSNLLNLTDGILSDAMRMQIVCTFNSDISNIDPALRRPGRLIGEYEFKPLDPHKVFTLVEEIYGEGSYTRLVLVNEDKVIQAWTRDGATLAQIYALEDPQFKMEDNSVKFGFT